MRFRTALGAAVVAWLGCNGSPGGSSSDSDADVGTLFGEPVSSYARVTGGVPTAVGVILPLAAVEQAPEDGPFQDELVLDMPEIARETTFLSQLRVNWLAHGHGPSPYGEAHFDLHFYRGTTAEIDAIDCQDPGAFPPEILTADHQPPTTCVSHMGYHAWPTADALPGAVFTASLILGYYAKKMVFIEPMIARSTLLARQDFELTVSVPDRTGGPTTLYPTRMRGLYVADEDAYHLEFDMFVSAD